MTNSEIRVEQRMGCLFYLNKFSTIGGISKNPCSSVSRTFKKGHWLHENPVFDKNPTIFLSKNLEKIFFIIYLNINPLKVSLETRHQKGNTFFYGSKIHVRRFYVGVQPRSNKL